MKQTLYIHIGRPKVGSSAIQHFLLANRDKLLEQGCIYPQRGLYQHANHRLALTFLPGLADYNIVKNHKSRDIYQQLIDEIKAAQVSKAVVSSEHFWLVEPGKIPAILRQEFDVKIVCYARRQDDVLASSIIQEIRGGDLSMDFDLQDYISDPDRMKYLDYYRVLEPWAKIFGRDNISVRILEHTKEKQGIENDLLEVLGLDSSLNYKRAELKKNASPSLDILELINEVNQFPVGDLAKRGLIGPLTDISQVIGFDASLDSKNLLSTQERQQILSTFADSNRQLGQTYLQQSPEALFPALEDVPALDKEAALDVNRLRRIIAGMLVYQQRHLVQMRGTINEQQRRIQRLEELIGGDAASATGAADVKAVQGGSMATGRKKRLANFISHMLPSGKTGNR